MEALVLMACFMFPFLICGIDAGGTAFERVVVLERRFSGTEIFHCIDNFSLYLL